MTNTEKVKHIRDITLSPFNKINAALVTSNGDVDGAIKILVEQKQADTSDMANRVADNNIVYSYVHNNKVGAMIVMSCQTDFVAKNELFVQLAKDICMHIVSNPTIATFLSENQIDEADKYLIRLEALKGNELKPEAIQRKIADGKLSKFYSEKCLINQNFIKDDKITIKQLIQSVSSTVGEKIEIKKFVRLSAAI